MKVLDVMIREPRAVRMVARADEAARILWEQDCGFVPVVDGANVVVGVLTDRDLCMASYTQGRAVANVSVHAVMAREVVTCGPDDSLADAMAIMAKAQVHRLPVVDARGVLLGVLSSNDLLQAALARPAAVAASKVLATITAIAKPRVAREFSSGTTAAKKPAAKKKAVAVDAAVAEASAKSAPASKTSSSKAATKKATGSKAASTKPATRASKGSTAKRKA